MKKNLFQKMIVELYKGKEDFGHQIIEDENVFIMLWNNPKIVGMNVAHTSKLSKEEIDIIKKHVGDTEMYIASNTPAEEDLLKSHLEFDETVLMMSYQLSQKMKEDPNYTMQEILTPEDLVSWCEIAGEVFDMQKDKEALYASLFPDLTLDNWHKYIGCINGEPAGIIEITQGKEASLISWIGVKKEYRRQGLCRAMLTYAINRMIEQKCHVFVLAASSDGQKAYSDFGFKTIATRYDYKLK